jgi:hypothetical protein
MKRRLRSADQRASHRGPGQPKYNFPHFQFTVMYLLAMMVELFRPLPDDGHQAGQERERAQLLSKSLRSDCSAPGSGALPGARQRVGAGKREIVGSSGGDAQREGLKELARQPIAT